MKGDPLGVERDELVIYLLGLCVISGLVTLFGGGASNAVTQATPDLIEMVWGGMLILGGASTLVGMFWQGDIRDGLFMKRTGMLALGIASALFGIFVLIAVGAHGLLTAGLTIGLSWACFRRWRRINRRIVEIIHHSQGVNGG